MLDPNRLFFVFSRKLVHVSTYTEITVFILNLKILEYWSFFLSSSFTRIKHPEVFFLKGVLKICSKFTRKHPCRSVISIKLLGDFIEIITLWYGCSPVNLLHIFETPFTKNTSGWLLLTHINVSYIYQYKHKLSNKINS